jgi:type I restriction enzyme R subunit
LCEGYRRQVCVEENEPKRLTLYKLASSLLRAYADIANDMIEADTVMLTPRRSSEVAHFENVRNEEAGEWRLH